MKSVELSILLFQLR